MAPGSGSPSQCTKDGTFASSIELVNNKTSSEYIDGHESEWGSGLTVYDWIVLLTVFLDCFSNILRFLPILSGRSTDIQAARSARCILTMDDEFVSRAIPSKSRLYAQSLSALGAALGAAREVVPLAPKV